MSEQPNQPEMSLLDKFLSLPEIKEMQDQGDLIGVGRLAISMGTIGRDKELRSYGSSLLKNEEKMR